MYSCPQTAAISGRCMDREASPGYAQMPAEYALSEVWGCRSARGMVKETLVSLCCFSEVFALSSLLLRPAVEQIH